MEQYDDQIINEIESVSMCPRVTNGNSNQPCILVRCKHHAIHRILSEQELNLRSVDEIADTILMLKETCSIDMLNTTFFQPEGSPSLNHSEIAIELGIPPERVRSTMELAFRKLRNLPTMRRLHQDHVSSNSHDPFKLRKKKR